MCLPRSVNVRERVRDIGAYVFGTENTIGEPVLSGFGFVICTLAFRIPKRARGLPEGIVGKLSR
jgi:hypothetical protein